MFIDFGNLDIDSLKTKYSKDEYFNKVLLFLENYLEKGFFTSHTSGSTGLPREIQIESKRADESARISNKYFEVNSRSHFLLCLDIRFIGSKLMLVRANEAKAKVKIVYPSLDFYKQVYEQCFDFVSLTPIQIDKILNENPKFFNCIGKCLIGGSPVTYQLENRISKSGTTAHFYESYGMTETLSHIAIRDIGKRESLFTALDGFNLSINEENCLVISHPVVLPITIVTNDIVDFEEGGRFKYLGRKDNIINSSGYKISPESIEAQWSQFLPFDFILAGEPDDILGQQLIMIVRETNLTVVEIQNILKAKCVDLKLMPKNIYLCSKWPQTESLKPIRKEIGDNKVLFS